MWEEDVNSTGRVVEAAFLFLFNRVWDLRSVEMTLVGVDGAVGGGLCKCEQMGA